MRTQVLDYLFALPVNTYTVNAGAALSILKLSIGSDMNEGHGSEPSYMHTSYDAPNVQRGWTSWLAREAVKRNPGISIMLTPYSFPGCVRGGRTSASEGLAASQWVSG